MRGTSTKSRWLPLLVALSLGQISFGLRPADAAAADIAGIWLGQDHDGHVEIKPCGSAMCGYIVSILDPTIPANPHDVYNEKPELRARPICELQVLGELKWANDEWDGWVYDPHRGKTFSVDLKLQDANTLLVHGYRALKFMGETKVWTRASKNVQRCARPAS